MSERCLPFKSEPTATETNLIMWLSHVFTSQATSHMIFGLMRLTTFQARNNKSNSQRAAETQLQSQRAQVSASVSQIASLAEVDLGTRA